MSTIEFGYATRDITPREPAWLQGYANRVKPSEGVSEPISIACLALRVDETVLLLVTCDLIGIHSYRCDDFAASIQQAVGIPGERIMFSCSHTHFGPGLSLARFADPAVGVLESSAEYVQFFRNRLVECAQECVSTLHAGSLEVLRVPVPQVTYNRRTVKPDGTVATNFMFPGVAEPLTVQPVDDELSVLRFRDETGVRAVVVNYGCHPVTGGGERERGHYLVSADYVYYLRRALQDELGAALLFTLGSAGDVVPADRYGKSRERIGSLLANTILMRDRFFCPDPAPTLDHTLVSVDVAVNTPAGGTDAAAAYEAARKRAQDAGSEDTSAAEAYSVAANRYFRSRLYPEDRYTVPVKIFRIGGTVLVGLPFEVLTEFSLRLKERFPQAVLISIANGYQGYLPFEHEYARGGYEASDASTHFQHDTADRLLEAVLERLERFVGTAGHG